MAGGIWDYAQYKMWPEENRFLVRWDPVLERHMMDADSYANTPGGAAKAAEWQAVLRILCMSAKDIGAMLGVEEGDLRD